MMSDRIRNILVARAMRIMERHFAFGEMSNKQALLAAYAMIAKIDKDDTICEEVAEFVINAMAALISILTTMPDTSISPLDFTIASYNDMLSHLTYYINHSAFADDLDPYNQAREIIQEIYDAMDAYL